MFRVGGRFFPALLDGNSLDRAGLCVPNRREGLHGCSAEQMFTLTPGVVCARTFIPPTQKHALYGGVPLERYPGYFRARRKLLKVSLADSGELGRLELKVFLSCGEI